MNKNTLKIFQIHQKQTNRKPREKWNEEELKKFEEGIIKYGKNYKELSQYIGTKTIQQIRSHCKLQKTKKLIEEINKINRNEMKIEKDDEEMKQKVKEENIHENEIKERIQKRIRYIDLYEVNNQNELNEFLNEMYMMMKTSVLNDNDCVKMKENGNETKRKEFVRIDCENDKRNKEINEMFDINEF